MNKKMITQYCHSILDFIVRTIMAGLLALVYYNAGKVDLLNFEMKNCTNPIHRELMEVSNEN